MYGYILRIALVGAFFAYPVPIGLLFSFIACALLYFSLKFVFLHLTSRPVAYIFKKDWIIDCLWICYNLLYNWCCWFSPSVVLSSRCKRREILGSFPLYNWSLVQRCLFCLTVWFWIFLPRIKISRSLRPMSRPNPDSTQITTYRIQCIWILI